MCSLFITHHFHYNKMMMEDDYGDGNDNCPPGLQVPSPQYIDSASLEPSTLTEEPVKYHEAWQKLCSAE